MGLFDRLTGGVQKPLTARAGLLLAAITMVSADGDVDDDELAVIRRLDGPRSTEAWEAAVKTWKARSPKECVELAAAAMSPEQRRCALANLIDIAMADGVLAGAERQLLESYVAAFGVDATTVEAIVDIVALKNNKSIFD